MPATRPLLKRWLITTMVAAIIVYGSLYPFAFRVPPHDVGPVATLIASVWVRPGRADALANVLLYMPFGFCFLLGVGARRYRLLAAATVIGGLLSLAMELTQYYDAWRVTSFSDVVTNTLGTLLGGVAAIAVGSSVRLPVAGTVSAPPIPALLIASWLAYRLYPYVPTANVHKYWNALKPIVLTPSLGGYDLFRQTAIWLTLCALIEAIVQRRRSAFLAPLFAVAVLCAMVVIVGIRIRLAEPVGAALALRRLAGPAAAAGAVADRRRRAGAVRLRRRAAARAVHVHRGGRPRFRLGPVPQPDAGVAAGRYAGVPGEVLPVRRHGLPARHRARPAAAGGAARGSAAVRDQLGGDLAARAVRRDHRSADRPARRLRVCAAAAEARRRVRARARGLPRASGGCATGSASRRGRWGWNWIRRGRTSANPPPAPSPAGRSTCRSSPRSPPTPSRRARRTRGRRPRTPGSRR